MKSFPNAPLQVDRRHPPGLANRLFATRQRNVLQMGRAYEVSTVGDEKLAAPDAAIASIASSVERNADDRPRDAVFGNDARNVRVVMLYADGCDPLAIQRVCRRCVVRMQVVGDDGRLDVCQPLERLDGPLERLQHVEVPQVADVRAEHHCTVCSDADGVLQVRAAGENRHRKLERCRNCHRDVAARTANEHLAPTQPPRDRIITTVFDGAIMKEKEIGDRAEASQRFLVAAGNRFVAAIATGHHQQCGAACEFFDIRQQQMMQRRVRQHHAEVLQTVGNGAGDTNLIPTEQQNNRT